MIQVYTGNGKGKTTAAIGLAVRASGAGLRVYIGQFIKGACYSEMKALSKFKNIKVEQFGRGCFIRKSPTVEDIKLARDGLERIKQVIPRFDLIILDEVNVALHFKLIRLDDVLKIIKGVPRKTEIILTGRCAPQGLLKKADLISEVKEVKHYYKNGVKARKGIEY